jgi:multicomponent K+:H+ antiporter subunit G
MDTLPLWLELPVAALLVVGGLFMLIGAIGMLRFPDFYMRLHAPTKATTLGVGGVLLASMAMSWLRGAFGVHELLITLFLFVTAPVSANLMAKAALHLRVPSRAEVPEGTAFNVGAPKAAGD